jgi:hypothetical protein
VVGDVRCAIAGKFGADHSGAKDWPDKSIYSNGTGNHQGNLRRGRTASDKAQLIYR